VTPGSKAPLADLGSHGPALDGAGQPEAETISGEPFASPQAATSLQDVLRTVVPGEASARDRTTGRFIGPSPNVAAGKTLARSAQFWAAVEPLKRDLVERVRTDLAADAGSVETLLGLVDAYAESRLFRSSMFLRLVDQGGPITNKGKARALYRAYLDALDRETKLAQVLGLERRAKPVQPLEAVRRAVEEANRK